MEAGSSGGPEAGGRSSSTAAPSANAAAGTLSPLFPEPTSTLDAWLQQVEQQPSQLLACSSTAEQRRQQHLALTLTLQQLDALAAAAFCSMNTRKKRRIISNDDASDTLRTPSFSDSKRTMTPTYFSSLLLDSSPLAEALPHLFSDPLASPPRDTAAGKRAAPGLGSPVNAGAGDACDDTQLRTAARATAKREEEGEQQQQLDENQALSLQQVWVFVDTTAWKLLRRLKKKVLQVHATELLCRRKAHQRRKKLRWRERKRSALVAASQAETCTEGVTGDTVEDLKEASIPDLPPDLPPPSSSYAAQQATTTTVGKGSAPAAAAAPTAAMETAANSSPATTATTEEAGTKRPPSRNGMAGYSPSDWTSRGGGGGGGGGFFWLLREQPSVSQQKKYVFSPTETAGVLEPVKTTTTTLSITAAADDVDSACEDGSGRDHEEEKEKDEEKEENEAAEDEEENGSEKEDDEEKKEGKAVAEISERGEDKREECVPEANGEEDKSDDMFFSMEDMQRFVFQEEERELAKQHAYMRKSNMLKGNFAVTNGVKKKKKKGKDDDSDNEDFFSADEDEEMWELLYGDDTVAATQNSAWGELKHCSRDRSSSAMYSDFFAAPSKTDSRREKKRSGGTTDNQELIFSKKRDRGEFDTVGSSTSNTTTSSNSSSKVRKQIEAAQVKNESAEEREEEEEEANDEERGEISALWKSRKKRTERSRKKDRKDEKERRDSNSSNSTTSSGSDDAYDSVNKKQNSTRGFPVGHLDAEERRLQRVLEEFEQQQQQRQQEERMKEDDYVSDEESEEDKSTDEVSFAIKKGKKTSKDDDDDDGDAGTKKTGMESTEEEEITLLRQKSSSNSSSSSSREKGSSNSSMSSSSSSSSEKGSSNSSSETGNNKQQEMKDDVNSLRGLLSHSNEVEAAMLELERQLVSKKEWKLQGEVWGKQRPRSALLDIGQLDLPLLASGLVAGESLGGLQTLLSTSSSLALGPEVGVEEEEIYGNEEEEEERRRNKVGIGGEIMSNYSSKKTSNNSDQKNISQLSDFIETLVKHRIMENLFDDVVRRTMLPETEQQIQQKQKHQQQRVNMNDSTRGGNDNNVGLNMQQSNMGLADIYAAEYQRQIANTGVLLGHQEKTHKLSEEEKKRAEILELFGKLLYKLDCLSNTSFRPAPAAATHFQNPTELEGIAAVRVEEAVPLLLSTATRQAPQELYRRSKEAEKEAFTREERRKLRQSKKEKRRKRIYHMVQSGTLTVKGAQERKMKLAEKNKLQKADKRARRQTGLTQHDAIKEMRKHSKKVKFQDLLSDALKASQNKNKRSINNNNR